MQKIDKETILSRRVTNARSNKEGLLCLSDTVLVDADLDAVFEQTRELTLRELDLTNNLLTDEGVRKVKLFCISHPTIKTLILNNNGAMTDASAIELLNVTTITDLQLWKNIRIKNPFAHAISQQQHLTKLDIRETGIDQELILKAHAHVRKFAQEHISDDSTESLPRYA